MKKCKHPLINHDYFQVLNFKNNVFSSTYQKIVLENEYRVCLLHN